MRSLADEAYRERGACGSSKLDGRVGWRLGLQRGPACRLVGGVSWQVHQPTCPADRLLPGTGSNWLSDLACERWPDSTQPEGTELRTAEASTHNDV